MAPIALNAPHAHPDPEDRFSRERGVLLKTILNLPQDFLQPSPALYANALSLTKEYLDPLAVTTSDLQHQKQNEARKKRKRGERHSTGEAKPLALKQIHVDGFKIDQIWEQAKRILDAASSELEKTLTGLEIPSKDVSPSSQSQDDRHTGSRRVRFREDEDQGDADDPNILRMDDGSDQDLYEMDDGMSDTADSEYNMQDKTSLNAPADGGEFDERQDIEEDADMDDISDGSEPDQASQEVYVPDKLGLNDGFFSIDDFNRQSEFLEQQDVRGEEDGGASDEEEIDWDADPLATGSANKAGKETAGEDEESSDGEDGPIFGNADLNAPDESDIDDDSQLGVQLRDPGGMQNTNDIKYAEFFAPPPRKLTKSDRRRALPKTQPPPDPSATTNATDEEMQRTIDSVRRDIFEDDLTASEDSANSDPRDRRSSHQKRQAKLTEEIRKLENAAVAKRDWTLSGEARAADRPINSLLEEDLEFERTGKPIPVITQEVSEDIETLIKRRILAREFDEVIRRRPGTLTNSSGKDVRRGRFELEDSKPQKSLAEMYESEHLKNVDPEGYTDKRSEALKKAHAKVEALWKDVSSKLDALSSLHFRPKPPEATVNVVADVPTITMEDARPAAGADAGGASMLAPQEVYKAGETRDKRAEVTTKSGLPVGREEMSRDEKVRRRRREKERIRKAGGLPDGVKKGRPDGRASGKKAEERKGVVGDLKRGNVRVIGRKGEIRDVEGNAVRASGALGKGAGGYKL